MLGELSACERSQRQQKTECRHCLPFNKKCTRCCNSRSSAWVTSGILASKGINLLRHQESQSCLSIPIKTAGSAFWHRLSQQECSPKRSGQHTLLVLFMNIQYLFQSFCQATVRRDHKPSYSR